MSASGGGGVSARSEVLARLRDAHAAASPPALPYDGLAREYRVSAALGPEERVERLADRLRDYRARVRLTTPADLTEVLGAALGEHGVRHLAVPGGVPAEWLSAAAGTVVLDEESDPLSVATLDEMDGVLTGCAAAIAETGTVVLDGQGVSGRRVLSLIPDYHLCVVRADQIAGSVPEALARLEGTWPLTFISGPSATSDIELNRVEGVHGPRTLEIVIVGGA